jgi:hypothetical protein
VHAWHAEVTLCNSPSPRRRTKARSVATPSSQPHGRSHLPPDDRVRSGGYTPPRSGDHWLGSATTTSRHATYPRPGGVRRTDRNGVGCSHREGCPLFPLLNASLRGWRDHYCDSEDRWHDCARYKLSLTGKLVPITLLPNGHDAQLLRPDFDADRAGAAKRKQPSRQAAPSQFNAGSPATTVSAGRFEPVPTSAPAEAPVPAEPLDESPPPAQVLQPAEISSAVPEPVDNPPGRLTKPARQARGWTFRWWTRLLDWMAGPA